VLPRHILDRPAGLNRSSECLTQGKRLTQVLSQPESKTAKLKPLCVDLDGTLVKSDTLVDSLLVMASTRPLLMLRFPERLLHGKAAFKTFVTSHVELDIAHLPYNRKLLHFLQQEHSRGRELHLATGADARIAERVAEHLGIFAGVLGTDASTNLTGSRKLANLRNRFGENGFAYIGNGNDDLPLLSGAAETMLANPSLGLRRRLRKRGISPAQVFEERSSPTHSLIQALRARHWAKNLLIFLPLLLAHERSLALLAKAFLAFFCFCCAASATYLIQDLLYIEADRRTTMNRTRPFASGDCPPAAGLMISAILLLAGLLGARFLPVGFLLWLLFYVGCTLAYSMYLKRIAIVDVLILSGLYTLRLLAGGAATSTPISHWLAGFAIFLFLSLATVELFAELEKVKLTGTKLMNDRGYRISDVEQIRSFGTTSAFAAAVVFANYIDGLAAMKLYNHPRFLWLIVPLMILWLCRVWLLASRGELDESPIAFALTDFASLLMGAAAAVIVVFAM